MKTSASAAIAATFILSLSTTTLAQDRPANPDRLADKPLEKHVAWAVGAGPSVTLYNVGDTAFALFHAHVSAMVGYEVYKTPLGTDVLSLSLGYMC